MSAKLVFELATIGANVLPCAIAIMIFHFKRPKHAVFRAILAIIVAWSMSVFYTALIYNPTGIAAGIASGMHFPENHYDNNTIASEMLGGWILPTISVAIVALIKTLSRRRK